MDNCESKPFMTLQDEAVRTAKVKNDMLEQAKNIIQSIPDPTQQATLCKKVMGDCCDVPQGCCHCNSNNLQ
jgi:hypothetical protein